MAASFEQLSKITGFNQCFEKVNLSFLAMKGDWVKHCLSVYPKMSEEAISLAWSRTFPTSTVLRAVLRAESKAYLSKSLNAKIGRWCGGSSDTSTDIDSQLPFPLIQAKM
jgi:hypothetical protein